MSIRLDIHRVAGGPAFESMENLAPRTRFGIEKALWLSGKDIQSEFNRQVLAKDKVGRLYIRRDRAGRGRRHRASAPGQTPANRTGAYRKGFDFSVDGAHQLTVGDTVPYAGFLELGTSRMKPRPGLGNSVGASERDIIRNLTTNIEDQL